MNATDDKKQNDDQHLEGQDLLGDIDLSGDAASTPTEEAGSPEAQASETPSTETPTPAEPETPSTPPIPTAEKKSEPDEDSKIVALSELKKLDAEAASDIHISTLSTLPPGSHLIKTLGLVQTAVLLQARRIQELRLQKGMKEVIHQLREEAVSQDGNAILGVQISVTPLGQLYPDSVWITACGTCCVIEKRKSRKKKSSPDDVEPIPQ